MPRKTPKTRRRKPTPRPRRAPTPTNPKGAGRPRKEITPSMVKEAIRLAGEGATNTTLAAGLGISVDLLSNLTDPGNRRYFAELSEGVETARRLAVHDARKAIFETIRDKKHRDRVKAALELLRHQDPEWKATDEPGSKGNPLHITLPGVQEFLKRTRGEKK